MTFLVCCAGQSRTITDAKSHFRAALKFAEDFFLWPEVVPVPDLRQMNRFLVRASDGTEERFIINRIYKLEPKHYIRAVRKRGAA